MDWEIDEMQIINAVQFPDFVIDSTNHKTCSFLRQKREQKHCECKCEAGVGTLVGV